jgi:hypothetical protein
MGYKKAPNKRNAGSFLYQGTDKRTLDGRFDESIDESISVGSRISDFLRDDEYILALHTIESLPDDVEKSSLYAGFAFSLEQYAKRHSLPTDKGIIGQLMKYCVNNSDIIE